MLDLKFIREHRDVVEQALKARNAAFDLGALLALDVECRAILTKLETLWHEKRKASDEIGKSKSLDNVAQEIVDAQILSLKNKFSMEKELEAKLWDVKGKIEDDYLLRIPNVPHASVPVGDASANQPVRTWGTPRTFGFTPKTHLELIESLGLVDLPRAAKITGSHWVVFTGLGARLERALINFMLDVHTKEHGYREIAPPYLVNRASMTGTGQLPKFEEDMYRLKDDDLFLIPTAEVPVTNLHAGEVLEEAQLPVSYTAYSACFRREAGSYGKETKGMTRVHQFDKVEMVKFVAPERSYDELEALVGHAETILQRLELPYRVVLLSTGDLGFAAAKCYDLEAWAPGLRAWLEVSSCSNFEAFQARRANLRYRQASTKKVAHLHTLNGSGVALARTFIALLEQHQNADGTVTVPAALRPYLDGLERLAPPR